MQTWNRTWNRVLAMDSLKTGIGIKTNWNRESEPLVGRWSWGNRDKHKSRIESPIPKIPNCFCAQLFLLQKRNSRHVSVKNHLHNACSERRKESPWLQYTKSTYVRNRGKKSLIFAAIFPKSDAGGVLFTETRFKGTRVELRLLGPCLALMCGLHFTIISLSTCY